MNANEQVPVPTWPEQDYLRFLSEGRFMIQRSRSSGRYVFYPRVAEPATGATDLEWVSASGEGTIYATTVVRQRAPASNYSIVLVDLAEGVRMMASVEGIPPEAVRIGMRVRAEVVAGREPPLVVFKPASA